MRKLIYVLMVMFLAVSTVSAVGTSNIDSHLIPKTDNVNNLGSSTKGFKDVHIAGDLTVQDSVMNQNMFEGWVDVPANGALTAAYSTGKDTAGFTTPVGVTITQTTFGRNMIIAFSSAVPAGATLAGVTVIVGTSTYGTVVTETLVTSNTVTGNVPFIFVSSITVTITACDQFVDLAAIGATKVSIALSSGKKLGLSNTISSGSDVYGLIEDDVAVAPGSAVINATYNTITMSSDPDGSKNFRVYYK